jgi:hypothetical protein
MQYGLNQKKMCQWDNKGMHNPIMKRGWGFSNIINNLEEMVGKTMEDIMVVITIGLCNHNQNFQTNNNTMCFCC